MRWRFAAPARKRLALAAKAGGRGAGQKCRRGSEMRNVAERRKRGASLSIKLGVSISPFTRARLFRTHAARGKDSLPSLFIDGWPFSASHLQPFGLVGSVLGDYFSIGPGAKPVFFGGPRRAAEATICGGQIGPGPTARSRHCPSPRTGDSGGLTQGPGESLPGFKFQVRRDDCRSAPGPDFQ